MFQQNYKHNEAFALLLEFLVEFLVEFLLIMCLEEGLKFPASGICCLFLLASQRELVRKKSKQRLVSVFIL